MILTAHQPVYMPWLGLFHKIALADSFISFDQVQYLPKDFNSRNRIKTASGPIWLTVPVQRKGYLDKPLARIEIDNSTPWGRKHLRSLQMNYSKSPFFHIYEGFLEETLTQRWNLLTDLNVHMLRWFMVQLNIDVPVTSAGEYQFEGRKSELVLDMCKKVGADTYVFGEQGRDYAELRSFENAGIRVVFQRYNHPTYPQLHGAFISHMSVIDLLANCGPESAAILMRGNLGRDDLLSAP